MATYVMLNMVFLLVVVLFLYFSKLLVWDRTVAITLLIVLVCTAIFDSLIIYSGIVRYNELLTLAITIGRAPIEDFFYAILASLIMPAAWKFFDEKG